MPGAKTRPDHAWKTKTCLVGAGLLMVILALLFHESFEPGMVAFSNDSPLGEFVANQGLMPQSMFGMWVDLNTLGYSGGSTAANVSDLIKLLGEWPQKY